MKRKGQLKSQKNVNAMPQPKPNEKQIRDDDPFQGLGHNDLNLNQAPRNDAAYQAPQQYNQYNQYNQYSRGVKYNSGRNISDDSVAMNKSSVETWVKQQEKAFTGWVNAHLQTRQMFVESLQDDIATVAPLIHLLEILEKKQLKEITKYHKKPRHKFDRLDGCRICLKQIRSRGRKNIKVQFDAEGISVYNIMYLYISITSIYPEIATAFSHYTKYTKYCDIQNY